MELQSPSTQSAIEPGALEAFAPLDRLGDEIAELAAHLTVATARLLDLIRWNGLLPRLVRHQRAKVALRP